MKLKGPGKATFNIIFHTHTVSGIVISFALFVIFYAGAWALFRQDLSVWENPHLRSKINTNFSYEQAIDKVDSIYGFDWYETVSYELPKQTSPFFSVTGKILQPDSSHLSVTAFVDTQDYAVYEDLKRNATASETIYHLHYFDQIPIVGRTISGLVSLFFLFAVVTGIIIHWRNLFTKFYAFVKEGKWKTIWTNMHTVLGVIGIPFQVMYAVTGAFFGILSITIAPSIFLVHDGDTGLINKVRFPDFQIEYDRNADVVPNITFTEALNNLKKAYPGIQMQYASLNNYGKADATITFRAQKNLDLATRGRITMRMTDGSIMKAYTVDPIDKPYKNQVQDMIRRLHYAEFGGFGIKLMFFVLSIFTCLVIISGILIWQTARNNKRYSPKQKMFHHRVTKVYLAICLSMFPAFGIIYAAEKLVPLDWQNRVVIINQVFFGSWLILTLIGCFWNSYTKQNQRYMMLGGLFFLALPFINGFTTKLWPWHAWTSFPEVALIDITWFMMGLSAIFIATKCVKSSSKNMVNTDEKNQIEPGSTLSQAR